jgi:Fe-S cluster assembly iron-binding protein IscA
MLTNRAARQLKETLVDAYLRTGGLDRLGISVEAERTVSQHLLKKCQESQVGFRFIMAREGELSMRISTPRNTDDIYEIDGLLIFADRSCTDVLDNYRLDYTEYPEAGFVLRRRPTANHDG